MSAQRTFELYYWPGFPGRGEFIRLLFECTRVPTVTYTDVVRAGGKQDLDLLVPLIAQDTLGPDAGALAGPFFAPPIVRDVDHDFWLSQTGVIVSYLGPILNLVPNKTYSAEMSADEAARIQASVASRFATLLDLTNETHDTHHPVAVSAYYEDQQDQALLRAADFRKNRLPKFLSFFERCLQQNRALWHDNAERFPRYAEDLPGLNDEAAEGAWLAYPRMTYADLGLAFVIEGLSFAFPKRMATLLPDYPLLQDCIARVEKLETLQAYKKSERHQSFSNGVFRHYSELDAQ